jgi:hypothetical protein
VLALYFGYLDFLLLQLVRCLVAVSNCEVPTEHRPRSRLSLRLGAQGKGRGKY